MAEHRPPIAEGAKALFRDGVRGEKIAGGTIGFGAVGIRLIRQWLIVGEWNLMQQRLPADAYP